MKLELKRLAPYLPHQLKGLIKGNVVELDCLKSHSLQTTPSIHGYTYCRFSDFKPILRPLSDLCSEKYESIIKSWYENTSNPIIEIYKNSKDFTITCTYMLMGDVFTDIIINRCETLDTRYWIFEELIKNHFDVFGLIEKGLAININTLEKS